MDLKGSACGLDWSGSGQVLVVTFVNMVKNFLFPEKRGNVWTICPIFSLFKRLCATELHRFYLSFNVLFIALYIHQYLSILLIILLSASQVFHIPTS
jgi:hypothetical protein